MVFFQKLLEAEANRRVRMCNLQSAKDCASVKTSLATVHARAQEMGNKDCNRVPLYMDAGLGPVIAYLRWSVRATLLTGEGPRLRPGPNLKFKWFLQVAKG